MKESKQTRKRKIKIWKSDEPILNKTKAKKTEIKETSLFQKRTSGKRIEDWRALKAVIFKIKTHIKNIQEESKEIQKNNPIAETR